MAAEMKALNNEKREEKMKIIYESKYSIWRKQWLIIEAISNGGGI